MPAPDAWPLDDGAFEPSSGPVDRFRRRQPSFQAVSAVVCVLGVTAAFAYDYRVVGEADPLVLQWNPTPLDWLFLASLAFAWTVVVAPLLQRPALARRLVRETVADRRALLATAFLGFTVVAGFAGPVLYGGPAEAPPWVEGPRYPAPDQPPVGLSVGEESVTRCLGPTADGRCFGSWDHPLGTSIVGDDVLAFVLVGMGVTTRFLFVGAMFVVPLAVGVGVTAGTVGGRVDEALMRYVDVQQSLPLFLAVIIALFVFGIDFWPILVVFGLLNWGSMARTIRSETLDLHSAEYVIAAEDAGAGTLWTIRRHVVPNVLHTITAGVGARLGMLLVLEALLTYLGLADLVDPSYGFILRTAIVTEGSGFPTTQWWSVAAASFLLAATVVALNVAGDAYRDVLSPRG